MSALVAFRANLYATLANDDCHQATAVVHAVADEMDCKEVDCIVQDIFALAIDAGAIMVANTLWAYGGAMVFPDATGEGLLRRACCMGNPYLICDVVGYMQEEDCQRGQNLSPVRRLANTHACHALLQRMLTDPHMFPGHPNAPSYAVFHALHENIGVIEQDLYDLGQACPPIITPKGTSRLRRRGGQYSRSIE